MASWGWFLAGFVAGVITYVGAGNGNRFVRFVRSRAERPRQPDMYVGDPVRRRMVHFSRQEEAGDDVVGSLSRRSEEVGDDVLGSVVVLDADDHDFIYEFGWMRRADAIELARALRHRFSEEPIAPPRPSSPSRTRRTRR
jgi:hypothetical protein